MRTASYELDGLVLSQFDKALCDGKRLNDNHRPKEAVSIYRWVKANAATDKATNKDKTWPADYP